jgi:predicted nucleic acid-binding protein
LILLDTNILLRYASATDPAFAMVSTAISVLHSSGESLCMVPQNVYEFWATATRPTSSNGLGLSVPECQVQVAMLKRLFALLPDLPPLFAEWEAPVALYACHGRVSYDARIVAAMKTHGMTRLLTLNADVSSSGPRPSIEVKCI